MTGEFTTHCNHYYELTKLLSRCEEHFKNLLDNAPLYCGQTSLSEVDAIISYYRKVQAAKAKIEKTADDIAEAARPILMIMRYFEIPPGTVLTGEIPGELKYEIWADEHDALYISKPKNLQPAPDNPNVITIKLWQPHNSEDEE
jgi:hypothetical protein